MKIMVTYMHIAQGQGQTPVPGVHFLYIYEQTSPNFELIQDLKAVLVTCKNEEDPVKMKALEC